ncbi:hypothetical protein, partial [Novosphingobium sp.]|uniref:hypothetical protein n=1 Tax=Novosphingobium sp. TaxID=1874826 RepID=UPI0035B296A8
RISSSSSFAIRAQFPFWVCDIAARHSPARGKREAFGENAAEGGVGTGQVIVLPTLAWKTKCCAVQVRRSHPA